MDESLRKTANDGTCMTVMRKPWKLSEFGFRYITMTCGMVIRFCDSSEVVRHNDLWYIISPGKEASEFINTIKQSMGELHRVGKGN